MQEILDKIIESLNQKIHKKSEYILFNDSEYEAIKIDKEHFKEIPRLKEENSAKVVFIDGGNNEIIKTPNLSLQLIRVYNTVYQNNERIKKEKKEFFVLVNAENNEKEIVYKIETFDSNMHKLDNKLDFKFNNISINEEDLSYMKQKVDISKIGEICRLLTEIKTCKELTKELNPYDIIVRDGDLQSMFGDQEKEYEELFNECKEKNVIMCGLSKTCQLFTNTGDSAINAIRQIAPEKDWYYHPVFKSKNKPEVMFTKLHPNSKYIFKFEIQKYFEEYKEKVISILKLNSKDGIFLGYPYGLIEADKFARVTNNEKEIIKMRILTKLRNLDFFDYMNSINAHKILDNM